MMTDGEIRQNKATKEWVIFAPARGKKLKQAIETGSGDKKEGLPVWDDQCPFCPGSRMEASPVIFEEKKKGGGWQNRVIPNKFPALTPKGDRRRESRGIYLAMPGHGRHEVIIESPVHNHDLWRMPAEAVRMVIDTYHRRHKDLMSMPETVAAVIFRNHGPLSGTSVPHPHSQIVATPFVPYHVHRRETEARRHFEEWGRCVYCEILNSEVEERSRIVLENASFAAFVPFAAEVPYEVWIMPRTHRADFGGIMDAEKQALAELLKETLGRLREKLRQPSYNFDLVSTTRFSSEAPYLHWFLRIKPRLTTAGFELGSGIPINPSYPEEDAANLREP